MFAFVVGSLSFDVFIWELVEIDFRFEIKIEFG